MSANHSDDSVPTQAGGFSDGNVEEMPTNTVPVKPESSSFPGVPVKPTSGFTLPPSDIGTTKISRETPKTGPLVYGLVALSLACLGGVAYSYSTRYPIPSESDLQSGKGPIVELVRSQLDAQKEVNTKEVAALKSESLAKLQSAETAARSTQKQQTAEIEKLNGDLKLKDEEIKKRQSTVESNDAEHKQEIAANQLKIDELEKNAQNARTAQVELAAEIEKLKAKIQQPVVLAPKSLPPSEDPEARPTPKKKPVNSTVSVETVYPSSRYMIGYGFDSKTEKGYWFFANSDGSRSNRFPSRELAAQAAEPDSSMTPVIARNRKIIGTK